MMGQWNQQPVSRESLPSLEVSVSSVTATISGDSPVPVYGEGEYYPEVTGMDPIS